MADTKQGNQNQNVDDLPESQRMRREAENDVAGEPAQQEKQQPAQQPAQQQGGGSQQGGGNNAG